MLQKIVLMSMLATLAAAEKAPLYPQKKTVGGYTPEVEQSSEHTIHSGPPRTSDTSAVVNAIVLHTITGDEFQCNLPIPYGGVAYSTETADDDDDGSTSYTTTDTYHDADDLEEAVRDIIEDDFHDVQGLFWSNVDTCADLRAELDLCVEGSRVLVDDLIIDGECIYNRRCMTLDDSEDEESSTSSSSSSSSTSSSSSSSSKKVTKKKYLPEGKETGPADDYCDKWQLCAALSKKKHVNICDCLCVELATEAPTSAPTQAPTPQPTLAPTAAPTPGTTTAAVVDPTTTVVVDPTTTAADVTTTTDNDVTSTTTEPSTSSTSTESQSSTSTESQSSTSTESQSTTTEP